MTQVLQVGGIVIAVIGAVVFAVASFGQMRAAREGETGIESSKNR
jgi:hypothetical protein